MQIVSELVKQPARKQEERQWPLKGSLVAFAGILYMALLLA
ncbi:hypothetical protein [Sporomusa aerivorans]